MVKFPARIMFKIDKLAFYRSKIVFILRLEAFSTCRWIGACVSWWESSNGQLFRYISGRRTGWTVQYSKMGQLGLFLAMLGALCVLGVHSAPDNPLYTTKYDNFDVDSVLNNQRLLRNYMKCILGEGQCTKEGTEVKSE